MNSIDTLLDLYESRRITRRQLAGAIAALAAGTTRGLSAQAPAASQAPAAQGATLNHASLAVSDVEKSAEFYQALLGLKVVSRPGNGGINMGLGTSFLGVYKLANPGTVNHICIGVTDYDPDAIAARLQARGVQARVDRNPANRTSGGDQLYFTDPDGTRVQLSANGYQG
jgi:catechol 2,3-dioxygenase-like lactoylglutathione lyase family enzyme